MSRALLVAVISLALFACDAAAAPPAIDAGPSRVHHREPDLATMASIPEGTFPMGHPVVRPGAYGQIWKENELPEHPVTLAAFRIDAAEVTVAEYAEFLAEEGGAVHWHPFMPIGRDGGGYEPVVTAAAQPISSVTWYDAVTFCAWAGKRLPTEAEWERAARGPDARTYPWGEDAPTCARAVFYTGAGFCAAEPAAVGAHPAGDSAEGCHDMAGNVAEWVMDVYDLYPGYSDMPALDPLLNPSGPATGRYRVVRGGGLHEQPASLRATARWPADPARRSVGIGFRCAVSP